MKPEIITYSLGDNPPQAELYYGIDAIEGLQQISDESVQCCVTSPPFLGVRDYDQAGQIGRETTPAEYVQNLVAVFEEVRRVLRNDGTCWLNLGDVYATAVKGAGRNDEGRHVGSGEIKEHWKHTPKQEYQKFEPGLPLKNLMGMPWRVAFALQDAGWWLRSAITLCKTNPMPERVDDRLTCATEMLFLLSKSRYYSYDPEPGKALVDRLNPGKDKGEHNLWDWWQIGTDRYPEVHFATMPRLVVEVCVLSGTKKGATVLDPFSGSGTTGMVALKTGRNFIGIDLNPEYLKLAVNRILGKKPPKEEPEQGGVFDLFDDEE